MFIIYRCLYVSSLTCSEVVSVCRSQCFDRTSDQGVSVPRSWRCLCVIRGCLFLCHGAVFV